MFAPRCSPLITSWASCSLCVFSSRNLSIYLSIPNFAAHAAVRGAWGMPLGLPASCFRAVEPKPITVDAEMRQLEVALSHDQWEAVPGRELLWARVVELLHDNPDRPGYPTLRSILVVPAEFDLPGPVFQAQPGQKSSSRPGGRVRLTSPFCPADTALRADIRRLSRAELVDLVTAPTRGCVHVFAEDIVRRALAFEEYPWLRNIALSLPGSTASIMFHDATSTMMEVLQPELLTLVLGSLDARSLLRASAASVSFRTLAHEEEL